MAHVKVVKIKLQEQIRLESERAALIAELEATLSAGVAQQVAVIMERRQSVAAQEDIAGGVGFGSAIIFPTQDEPFASIATMPDPPA